MICTTENASVSSPRLIMLKDTLIENQLVLKLRGARQRKRAKTGRCEGRKPFGHYEGEQAVILRMRELRASGLTLAKVAEQMNAEGVPTRARGRWHAMAVQRILKRDPQ